MICWEPIDTAPRNPKRQVLLAEPNVLGTIDGGDGKKLHPDWPYLVHLATWNERFGCWEAPEGDDVRLITPEEVSHWAEITFPTDGPPRRYEPGFGGDLIDVTMKSDQ